LPDLEAWLRFKTRPGLHDSRLGESRLHEILRAFARTLGTAFDAYIQKLRDAIPRILARLPTSQRCNPDGVAAAFWRLARAAPTTGGPTLGVAPSPSSCNNISNLVRQALAAIPMPHDGATNVRP